MARAVVSAQAPKPFSKLPKRKREFVKEYVKQGGLKAAYLAAGYKDAGRQTMARARKAAQELAPYLDEQLGAYLKSTELTIFGLSRLRELAVEADSEQVQFNAAKEILNRNLPDTPKEVKHTHTQENMTDHELIARIKQLQGDLALPIEGESKVVSAEDDG